MSTSVAVTTQPHANDAHAIRTKQDAMDALSLQQASQKKDSVIPTGTTAAAAAAAPAKTGVKVSNINVADERFHLSMIGLLGCVLSQLVQFEESQYPNGRGPISMFHTAYVPSISIGSYLKRIALYTKVSSEVLIQSVLHVHQLMQRSQNPLIVNKLNIHRLLLTSIMATAKFFDDAHYNNSYYSFVGGVPLKELNALEVEFLSLLNFDFYVNTQTYQYFYTMVVERNIHQNGCTCTGLLHGLPKSLPVSEYAPDADVLDFPPPWIEPVSAAMQDEDASMESVSTQPRTCVISAFGSSASASSVRSVTPKAAAVIVVVPPSALMDDMGEELGSIRIEEDPMCTSTTDDEAEVAEHTPKQSARTPKRLAAHHLHVQQQVHPSCRSSSPVSFLSSCSLTGSSSTLSSAIEASPVSSASYSSSLSYPSRQQQAYAGVHGSGQLSSYASASQSSPSLSLSSTFHGAQPCWGSVQEDGEEADEPDYLSATPRQCSATPLAGGIAQQDALPDMMDHDHKERALQRHAGARDPTAIV